VFGDETGGELLTQGRTLSVADEPDGRSASRDCESRAGAMIATHIAVGLRRILCCPMMVMATAMIVVGLLHRLMVVTGAANPDRHRRQAAQRHHRKEKQQHGRFETSAHGSNASTALMAGKLRNVSGQVT
jgi:hypothetical protein